MKTARLSQVCKIVNGGTPKSDVAEYWHGDVAWLTPAEMGKRPSPYISDTARKISSAGLANSSARQVPVGSVIMSTRAPIGHLSIPEVPMAFNQGCRGLIPAEGLDTKYLYYFLWFSREPLNELGTGTTFKELSSGALGNYPIPLPPLEGQQRIVAVLDEAFAAIATATTNAAKNLANAKALFQGCLEQVFDNGGENWQERPLGQVCRFIGGSQPPKSVFSTTENDGLIRLIQIRDYKSDRHKVFIPKELARRFCSSDDVMIGRYGPPLFQILRGLDGAYNVALMKAAPDTSIVSKDFLYYFMRNARLLQHIIAASDRAAGQIGLTKETIEPYPIKYPNLAEQEGVVDRLREIESETIRLEGIAREKLAALAALKQAILREAFAGNVDTTQVETIAA